MFTVTAHSVLPCSIAGSWPRPHWFDLSMLGRPLDTCMMDVKFRERFQDALATVLSDQTRAGTSASAKGLEPSSFWSNFSVINNWNIALVQTVDKLVIRLRPTKLAILYDNDILGKFHLFWNHR